MSSEPIVLVTEKQKIAIREKVGYTSEEKLKSDVDAILEWYQKQHHLPRINLDERYIISVLISRKGSVEQTKQKIDYLFSLRNIITEMAAPRDILNPRLQNTLQSCVMLTLPRLNKDLTRVTLLSYKGLVELFNVTDIFNYFLTTVEYRLIHDNSSGDRYVVDMADLSLSHITKFTPSVVKYCELYIRKAYGLRVFGIHFMSSSSLMNKMLAIFKAGLSDKLKARISIHDTYEDLHQHIDKYILPSEYGGKEKSIDELKADWVKELSKDENRKYLMKQEELRSNESLRMGSKLDSDLLGIAGTFRKLDVD